MEQDRNPCLGMFVFGDGSTGGLNLLTTFSWHRCIRLGYLGHVGYKMKKLFPRWPNNNIKVLMKGNRVLRKKNCLGTKCVNLEGPFGAFRPRKHWDPNPAPGIKANHGVLNNGQPDVPASAFVIHNLFKILPHRLRHYALWPFLTTAGLLSLMKPWVALRSTCLSEHPTPCLEL